MRSSDIINALDGFDINGTVCVTRNGETVLNTARGMADRERGIPYTVDTKTYIASVTKQFTAACVMMLREEGLIDIDEKLIAYVPEYAHADRMTLRQMLNMTSGIPHELVLIDDRLRARRAEFDLSDRDFEILVTKACAPEKCSVADFLEIVNSEPLNFEPGERYEYSDTNYMLLGEIVARRAQTPLSEFMKKRIFEPLSMNHTVLGADYSDAPSYCDFGGEIFNMGKAHFKTGEGSICTTAGDMCLWLNCVLAGGLISKESWQECFKMVNGYGFGWGKNQNVYTHDGGDLGYSSSVGVNFETKSAFAYALNIEADPREGADLSDELADIISRED